MIVIPLDKRWQVYLSESELRRLLMYRTISTPAYEVQVVSDDREAELRDEL